MLQVKLKINTLKLHIIEPVLIQLAIRNQKSTTITIPSYFPLFKGQSEINSVFQFLTSTKKLQLCVILFKNYERKLGGVVEIDLNNIKSNQQNKIVQSLKDCLDENGEIQFLISYKKSRESFHSIDLMSINDRQMMKILKQQSEQEYHLKQVKQKNLQIETQYNQLFKLNRYLYQQLQNRESEHSRVQSSWDTQINLQQQDLNNIINKLQKQKIIVAQIIDIVLGTGDSRLIDKVQNILGIKQFSQSSENLSQHKQK